MRLDGALNTCAKTVSPGKYYDAFNIERNCVSPCTGATGCLSTTLCVNGHHLRTVTDANYNYASNWNYYTNF